MTMGLSPGKQIDKLLGGICVLLCLAGNTSRADTLEQIEVIGTSDPVAVPTTGDVIEHEHSGFSSRITLPEKQSAGSLSLADIVSQEAGTQVRSSGGLGSYSEISLRGTSSEQVMIYLDGLLLNEGSGGGVDLSLIDLSHLSNIDIYRGSTPIQLGNASFGGAVNLITARTGEGKKAGVSATIGSFGTHKLSGRLSARKDRLDGLVAVGSLRADNDFEFKNDNGTQYNPDDDRIEKRNNANVSQDSALVKMGWQQSATRRVDVSFMANRKDQSLPSWNNHPNTDTELDTQTLQLRAKLTSDGHFDDRLNTALELHGTKKNELYDDRNGSIGLGSQYDENITRTHGLKAYMEWLADTSTTVLTTDLRQETYRREDRLANKNNDKSQRRTLSIGVQHSRFLADDRLTLTPQLRLQKILNDFKTSETSAERQTHKSINPGLGLSYAVNDQLTIQSNIGRYVREPAFFELFGDRGFILGNSDLKAETGTNIDIGFILRSYPSHWNLRSVKTRFSASHTSIDDMIVRAYNSQCIGKASNVAAAQITGVEFDTRLWFQNKAALALNLTLQRPENQSENPAFKNKILPGRARQSLSGSIEWPVGRWMLRYELNIRHNSYYDTANLLKAKNQQVHNLRLSRDLGKNLSAVFELNNVADKQLEDFNGYPKPGRAAFITLNYDFNPSEAP